MIYFKISYYMVARKRYFKSYFAIGKQHLKPLILVLIKRTYFFQVKTMQPSVEAANDLAA